MYENPETVSFLKSKGYDSMMVKESSGADEAFDTLALFNTNQLRSRFADFDLLKRNSGNLTAGGLLGAYGINEGIEQRNNIDR